MPPTDTIDLRFLQHQMEQILEDLRQIRQQNVNILDAVPKAFERSRQLDARFNELSTKITNIEDDLVSLMKMEIGGGLAHMETRLENSFGNRFESIERHLQRLESKLDTFMDRPRLPNP
jgi:hypothetical protein